MSRIVFEVEVPSSEKESEDQQAHSKASASNLSPDVWTVSALTRQIRFVLESKFRSLMIEGELSNVKRSTQGHLYCQLKDEYTQIRGVMFRQAAGFLKFEPTNGLEVVVKGHLGVYEPRGEYQIILSSMEPKGMGSLQLAFEQLKEKLQKEGLFDSKYKQPIPWLPRRIGIVTSATGAVIHDMLHVLNRRCPNIPILIYPASVQGDQAPTEVVAGIEYLNTLQKSQEIDVLIVGRGGGSTEDLWAWNDERIAQAIFCSKIPVISAVGHETDFTIADFVSDLRAPTPSAAMEMAVPHAKDLLATVEHKKKQLLQGIERHFQQQQENVQTLTARLRSPDFIVHQHQQQLDELLSRLQQQIHQHCQMATHTYLRQQDRLMLLNPQQTLQFQKKMLEQLNEKLQQTMKTYLTQNQDTLSQKIELLDALSPLTILKRGYGMVLDHSQKPVSSIKNVEIGDFLSIRLQDGHVQTLVKKKSPKTSN